MTTALPKRLIEVDLPIKRISAHSRREKSIRHGHISTLHIWWARRPLAACRAVLCAALWPDPADPLCPDNFRKEARYWMEKWVRENLRLLGAESLQRFLSLQKQPDELEKGLVLRTALLDFIADFANWDNSAVKEYLETSRALTNAAQQALGGAEGTKALVVDPFSGGGSIPLEALRVGADAFASDLNPVAVLLNKVLIESVPKFGDRLTIAVRQWGNWVREAAQKELRKFYPSGPDGEEPIAFIWARTVISESPSEDKIPVEIPLLSSFWLSKKPHRLRALRWARDEKGAVRTEIVQIEYSDGTSLRVRRPLLEVFEPKRTAEVEPAPARRGSCTCPITGYTTPAQRVRAQLLPRHGGAADARLICVVGVKDGEKGRIYRSPDARDSDALARAREALRKEVADGGGVGVIPNEELPIMSGVFNAPIYGHSTWGSLFNTRQTLSLLILKRLILDAGRLCFESTPESDIWKSVVTVLAMNLSKLTDYGCSLTTWLPQATQETVGHTFGRQALPMVWDYAEANPLAASSGGWSHSLGYLSLTLEETAKGALPPGHVAKSDAASHPLPDDSAAVFFTDPPYYNAVPYADLSDFFYVWLRRCLREVHQELFDTALAPKKDECCEMAGWDSVRYPEKDGAWFENKMKAAMAEGRRILAPDGIGTVVFAHKSTSGWEAQIQAMLDAGWVVTGSWPIDTERGARLRALGSAALASSVHIVVRPREKVKGASQAQEIGDWRDVLNELPLRIHEWMPRLADEGVVGADAIFACLGPALEIFSRHSHVEKANGDRVGLDEYLVYVWAAVSKEALAMVFKGADASGFEEDARLTAMWLWTLFAGESGNGELSREENDDEDEATASGGTAGTAKGFVLEYDAARKIAQGLGAHLESLTSIVEVKGEVARLLPVAERTQRLFGKNESEPPTSTRKKKAPQLQLGFVAELEQAEESGIWGSKGAPEFGATVLDRVHQCMILFAAGRSEALRRFLVDEGVGRDERFWRLAQVLSYLYPKSSDEKRWIDGVLARKKGLGF